MPLPRTRVIPAGWSEHHRAAAELTMTATGQVTRESGEPGGWNPVTGAAPSAAASVIYTGPCRVQALKPRMTGGPADAAGQAITDRKYLVAIRADAAEVRAGQHGDIFTVISCPDDPLLEGKPMRVVEVGYGSVSWQRSLFCDDDLTND